MIGVGSPAGRAGLAVAGRPVAPAGPSVSLLKISAVLIEGPSGSLGSAPERPGEAFEGPEYLTRLVMYTLGPAPPTSQGRPPAEPTVGGPTARREDGR